MKTNVLFYWENAFGEKEIVNAIKAAQQYLAVSSHMFPITNPALRFLMNTTKIQGGHLKSNFNVNVPHHDYVVFNFVGSLLKHVADEILASPSLKKELMKDLLGVHEGPFLSAKNELTVAAFYKSKGYDLKMSSSADVGLPDVILTSEPFASDAKLFPDNKLQLAAAVNESEEVIRKCFTGIYDSIVVLMLLNPSKSKFQSSLKQLSGEIKKPNFRHFRDANLVVMPIGNEYKAGDIKLTVVNQNLSLHFQANWPMDEPVNDLKKKIIKSVNQGAKAGKQSVSWIEIVGSAKRHAIEMQMLRHIVDLDSFVKTQNGLDGLVIYSVEPAENNSLSFAVDVYGQGPKKLGIDNDSVSQFLKESANIKELLIP